MRGFSSWTSRGPALKGSVSLVGCCCRAVSLPPQTDYNQQELFELVYTCRTADGLVLDTAEECGIEVCLDAATNPAASEITYQV